MKQIRTYMTVAVLLSIFAPATLLAHHHAVNFLEETIAFFGEVTRVDWTNPHVYIYLETEGDDGTPVEWEIETGSTPSLTRRGWQPDTLKPGDSVTVRGRPDRNPERKFMSLRAVTAPDGTPLVVQGRPAEDPNARATSIDGIWQALGGPYDRAKAATHLPLTEKAKAIAANFDVANDPFIECVAPPVPDSLSTPYLHQIIVNDDDTITLREEYWEIDRTVYMDGRGHPENGPRTNQGHSIGQWEGDVLVVDTVLFDDHAFGNGAGIPNGAQKHMVERYEIMDDDRTLSISYVLEDAEYLAEPVTDTREWRYAPHLEMLPNTCDLEIARRSIQD
ncbi:DUF6152 family protein [Candidatus Rariloculus sp.]|uniref:DUF6152 family protein n=1 Tax=Candidatus Rariloculus sp. TaxID=3101265 RepID=UPI003D118CAD